MEPRMGKASSRGKMEIITKANLEIIKYKE